MFVERILSFNSGWSILVNDKNTEWQEIKTALSRLDDKFILSCFDAIAKAAKENDINTDKQSTILPHYLYEVYNAILANDFNWHNELLLTEGTEPSQPSPKAVKNKVVASVLETDTTQIAEFLTNLYITVPYQFNSEGIDISVLLIPTESFTEYYIRLGVTPEFLSKILTETVCRARLNEVGLPTSPAPLVLAFFSPTISEEIVVEEATLLNVGRHILEHAIDFAPEYYQAGVKILAYFGEILRRKDPNARARVRIEQDGSIVRLHIELPTGEIETIEQELEQYAVAEESDTRYQKEEGYQRQERYQRDEDYQKEEQTRALDEESRRWRNLHFQEEQERLAEERQQRQYKLAAEAKEQAAIRAKLQLTSRAIWITLTILTIASFSLLFSVIFSDSIFSITGFNINKLRTISIIAILLSAPLLIVLLSSNNNNSSNSRLSKILQERKELNQKIEKEAKQDIFHKVQLNLNHLDEYYITNQKQAKNSFYFSIGAASTGLATIFTGIWFYYFKVNDITGTYTTSIAGVILEFIGGAYFFIYKKSLEQVNVFFNQLVVTQDTLIAVELSKLNANPEKRATTQKKIITSLLERSHK